jgi:hypothetical protein
MDKSISVDESGRKVGCQFPFPSVDPALVGSHRIKGLKEKKRRPVKKKHSLLPIWQNLRH